MKPTKKTITVNGMHCTSCSMIIRETLEDAGAKDVMISLDKDKQIGTVAFTSDLPDKKIKELIENEGEYTVR